MCPLKVDPLSVTFDPETAETRLLIVTHPSAAITLQLSRLRHDISSYYTSLIIRDAAAGYLLCV